MKHPCDKDCPECGAKMDVAPGKEKEMRDRLIELLQHAPTDYEGNRGVGAIADHLLANGVIVPPCKEGDMLYQPINGKILEYKVLSWCVREWGVHITTQSQQTGGLHPIKGVYIGNAVFLTREEAEKALAERSEG